MNTLLSSIMPLFGISNKHECEVYIDNLIKEYKKAISANKFEEKYYPLVFLFLTPPLDFNWVLSHAGCSIEYTIILFARGS
jgi:hypothetical protein